MPNTKMRKDDWKNFLDYSKWVYVGIIAVAFLLSDLIYTATRYTTPDEKLVSFQIVTSYIDTEITLQDVANQALEVGKAYDSTLEEVAFYNISYNPEDATDTYGYEKYSLMLGVCDGDIYVLPFSQIEILAADGYLTPLEGYIEEGLLNPGEVDLEKCTFHECADEEDYDPEALHVYAIPMTNMYGMMDLNYDNRDGYMCLLSYSKNKETSVVVMNYFIESMTREKPGWVAAQEEKAAEAAANPVDPFDAALENAGYGATATEAPADTDQ